MALRWPIEYERQLIWTHRTEHGLDCQGNWDAYPHPYIDTRYRCGSADELREERFVMKDIQFVVVDLECPEDAGSDCRLLDPASLGLPSKMSWSDFAAWVGDTYGSQIPAVYTEGSVPGHTYSLVVGPLGDLGQGALQVLGEGDILVATGKDFGAEISNGSDLSVEQWYEIYSMMYCTSGKATIQLDVTDGEAHLIVWDSD